jgi:hypothetical protein
MKKTTKKSAAKASRKRALKNLDVKPAKGGTVRGGDKGHSENCSLAFAKVAIEY